MSSFQPGPPLPPERLRAILGNAVMRQVALGWRVESQLDNHAMMAAGGDVNHPVHLVISLLTCGAWVPIWLILAVTGSERRLSITVDPHGVVLFNGRPAMGPILGPGPVLGPGQVQGPRPGPVVGPRPGGRAWRANRNAAAIADAKARRELRKRAREQAEKDPALARELRIGRPDLPREYDDGGLIDVNHVPPSTLTMFSGVTPEIAERIFSAREHLGRFSSAEEVVVTADLHPDLASEIREYGIFLA